MKLKTKLPDRLTPGLLLVPVLMFLGRLVYDGIVLLLKFLLETYGDEVQLIRWEPYLLDQSRSFGGYCAICLIVTLVWIPLIARQKQLSREKRFVWYGSYLVFAVILLGFFLPQLGGSSEIARRIHCFSNLKQIHMALTLYANDHSGWFPPDLETLKRTAYLDDDRIYHCPGERGRSGGGYDYFGRGHKVSDPPFTLLSERGGIHPFRYRNTILSNGQGESSRK